MESELKSAFKAGELSGLHSVLVIRDGTVLADVHFSGEDENWGKPLGRREHGPDTLHDLRSVTKSIVGLLYGIALSEGLVPALDECLVCQFPEYGDLAADPERRKILVRHALAMQMGTEWDEDRPYTDPENSEIAMEMAADRFRFVLDRPLVEKPGARWTYNGGATAVIAHLIARGTGMPIDAYAREKLFGPLGIATFEWNRGDDGIPSAASGLRMSARDLARIGQLVLDDGVHDGRRIVPKDWLDRSFTPRATLETGLRYGYFWWLAPGEGDPVWVAGFGNGGQRLSINRSLGLVFIVFAGNYNRMDAWELPLKISTDFLTPALRRAGAL
ncbi:MAG: serine hydrolase [Rhodobiaceae bacterium]|nr:serine hydrolase [Rhodobiaceae bacterium]